MTAKRSENSLRRAVAIAAASVLAAAAPSALLADETYIGPQGGFFSDASHWNQNRIPDSSDVALIIDKEVFANDPIEVSGLVLGHLFGSGAKIATAQNIKVTNKTAIDGAGSQLAVFNFPGLDFQSATLEVTNSALFFMNAGQAIVSGNATFDSSTTISGVGTFQVGGLLETNSAEIIAGGLELKSTGSGKIDLNNNHIDVTDISATMKVNGPLTGPFGGKIDVSNHNNGGNSITFAGWTLGAPGPRGGTIGELNLNGPPVPFLFGGGATPATLNAIGSSVHVLNAQVNVTGLAAINGITHFNSHADVNVASGGLLTLNGSTTYSGGSYTGAGILQQNGDASIQANTTISVDIYDWDGNGTPSSTFISGATFTINASQIDLPPLLGTPAYKGTIFNTAGHLVVNVPSQWLMRGNLTLESGTAANPTTLDGSKVVIEEGAIATGFLNVRGTANITAPLEIRGSQNKLAILDVSSATAVANLNGETTFNGGTINGVLSFGPTVLGGIVHQNANAFVVADSAVNCHVYDMDGAGSSIITINPGVGLFVTVDQIDDGNDSYQGTLNLNGGQLKVLNAAHEWSVEGGTVNMTNTGGSTPMITGDTLRLASNVFTGTIKSVGDAKIGAAFKVASSGGIVDVQSGTLTLASNFLTEANATLNKNGGGTLAVSILSFQNHGLGAAINVNGGVLEMNSDAQGFGAGPNLTIRAKSFTTVLFNSTQRLAGLEIGDSSLARFSTGSKMLVTSNLSISNSGDLDLNDSDMIKRNTAGNGPTSLGAITTLIKSGRHAGAWDGPGIVSSAAKNDPNHITGLAVILNRKDDGTQLFGTFEGQIVDIDSVLVKYTYDGDVDLNGKVDGLDYFLVDSGFLAGATDYRHGDLDFNGKVDGLDYFLIDSAFLGQTVVLSVADPRAVAVPEPAGLLSILGVALLTGPCARRARRVKRR